MVLGKLAVHTVVGLGYTATMAVSVLIYKFKKWLTGIGVKGFTMTMLYGAEAVSCCLTSMPSAGTFTSAFGKTIKE
jgi:hypothetical protein